MINLLPPKEKEALLLNQYKNLTIVLGGIVIVSLVCLVLVLLAAKFYLLGEMNYEKITSEVTEKKYHTQDFLFFKELIQKYNKTAGRLNNFYKEKVYFSNILKVISETQRPPGLFFTTIAIRENQQDGKIRVMLSGVSESRENLLVFRDTMKNISTIENISLSPESLVKPTNVNFSLTFSAGAVP